MPDGELTEATSTAVDRLLASVETSLDFDALKALAAAGDARLAWVVAAIAGGSLSRRANRVATFPDAR